MKKVVNISLSKKLKNIQDKEEDTKNTLFFLKCQNISNLIIYFVLFFIVCIAIILYFVLK